MAKLMEDFLHGWNIIKDMFNNVQEVMANGELLLTQRYFQVSTDRELVQTKN